MNYFKNLGLNFLVVFFANHILPGIEVGDQTKLPHLGSDLIFALVLGGINSLIFKTFKFMHREPNGWKIAIVSLIVNFAVYALVKLIPIGIYVVTVKGYVLASAIVTICSFFTNYYELKQYRIYHHTDMPS